jgi:hypothetical protein
MTKALRYLMSLFTAPVSRLSAGKPAARRQAPHRKRRVSTRAKHHRAGHIHHAQSSFGATLPSWAS